MSDRGSARRATLLAALVVAAAFAAGIGTGIAVSNRLLAQAPGDVLQTVSQAPGALPPPLDDLNLSREQRTRVEAVLEHRRKRTEAIMRDALPHLRHNLDSLQREVRTILTSEQRARFDRVAPLPASATPVTIPMGPPPGSATPVTQPFPPR